MGEHDRVELTEQLYEVLKRVAHTLSHGQSISILTRDEEISTQQAAEILGLSRPTVVRLIQDGELHAHAPGAVRRKLRLAIARTVVGCSRSWRRICDAGRSGCAVAGSAGGLVETEKGPVERVLRD
jgi:excisionase family DNA binding protein